MLNLIYRRRNVHFTESYESYTSQRDDLTDKEKLYNSVSRTVISMRHETWDLFMNDFLSSSWDLNVALASGSHHKIRSSPNETFVMEIISIACQWIDISLQSTINLLFLMLRIQYLNNSKLLPFCSFFFFFDKTFLFVL